MQRLPWRWRWHRSRLLSSMRRLGGKARLPRLLLHHGLLKLWWSRARRRDSCLRTEIGWLLGIGPPRLRWTLLHGRLRVLHCLLLLGWHCLAWDEGFPRLWRPVLHRRLGVLHCLLLLLLERQSLGWVEGLPRLRGAGLYRDLLVLLHSLLLRRKSLTLKEGFPRLRGTMLTGDLLVLLHSLLLLRWKSLTLEGLPRLHRPLGLGLSLDKLYRSHPLRLSLNHHWLRLSLSHHLLRLPLGHGRWARGTLRMSLNLVGILIGMLVGKLSRSSILHSPRALYCELARRWLPSHRSLSSRLRHLA